MPRFYKDTYQNRKLDRVGKEIMSKKTLKLKKVVPKDEEKKCIDKCSLLSKKKKLVIKKSPKKKKLIIKPKKTEFVMPDRPERTDEEEKLLTTYEDQLLKELPMHKLTDMEYEAETRRLEAKYLKVIRGEK
jgi:hypothetical protein